ncbi:MAG: hypothetical protein HYU37_05535 [Acidobacteria bacterium]|nr:hypothetical protein [Acidobacteriota bacterium]
MHMRLLPALLALAGAGFAAETHGTPEEFTAVAVAANNVMSGAGTVLMSVDRWSTDAERTRLVQTLRDKGPNAMLDAMQDMRPVGRIRTPDSLGYDLRYAQQTRAEDGGRRIVIATDRPIGFWEAWHRPRSIDYPFTVIQMQIGPDRRGKGTMSIATKIRAYGDTIELEDFASSPVMLTDIRAARDDE